MTRFQIVGGALHFLHQIDGTRGKAKGAQSAVSRELLEVHAPGACGCVRVCAGSRARVRVRVLVRVSVRVRVRVHACMQLLERQLLPPNSRIGWRGCGVRVNDERALRRKRWCRRGRIKAGKKYPMHAIG